MKFYPHIRNIRFLAMLAYSIRISSVKSNLALEKIVSMEYLALKCLHGLLKHLSLLLHHTVLNS